MNETKPTGNQGFESKEKLKDLTHRRKGYGPEVDARIEFSEKNMVRPLLEVYEAGDNSTQRLNTLIRKLLAEDENGHSICDIDSFEDLFKLPEEEAEDKKVAKFRFSSHKLEKVKAIIDEHENGEWFEN